MNYTEMNIILNIYRMHIIGSQSILAECWQWESTQSLKSWFFKNEL